MTSAATLTRQFTRLAELSDRSVLEQAAALGVSRLTVYALRSKARKAGFNVVRIQQTNFEVSRKFEAVVAEMTYECERCHLRGPHAVCLGRADDYMRTGNSEAGFVVNGRTPARRGRT